MFKTSSTGFWFHGLVWDPTLHKPLLQLHKRSSVEMLRHSELLEKKYIPVLEDKLLNEDFYPFLLLNQPFGPSSDTLKAF